MRKISFSEIQNLWDGLGEIGNVASIQYKPIFYDDPSFYHYAISLNAHSVRGKSKQFMVQGSGNSLFSRREALIKALGETYERAALHSHSNHKSVNKSFKELKDKNALDPSSFEENKVFGDSSIVWVKGTFNNKSSTYIPAQMVFLSYVGKNEKHIRFPQVSTGAAGGFAFENALLSGIYEVIERDAFMNTYLATIAPPRINPYEHGGKSFRRILKKIERYKLELYVFDITNNLNIPTFMSILVDRTGFAHSISIGAKSSFNTEKAIMASVSEACTVRIMTHSASYKNAHKKVVHSLDDRRDFWFDVSKLKYLDFLLNAKIVKRKKMQTANSKDELKTILEILKKNNLRLYHSDISTQQMKKIGYVVLKVIIPELQPLFLDERERKYVNIERVRAVAEQFGKRFEAVNPIPHPFL